MLIWKSSSEKWIYRFNVLWDSALRPHCPNCKRYLISDGEYMLTCTRCKNQTALQYEKGVPMTLGAAREHLWRDQQPI